MPGDGKDRTHTSSSRPQQRNGRVVMINMFSQTTSTSNMAVLPVVHRCECVLTGACANFVVFSNLLLLVNDFGIRSVVTVTEIALWVWNLSLL